MATWPKGPQKLKFEHAICILKLLILSRARLWPINWRFWVASGPTSSRASHQDLGGAKLITVLNLETREAVAIIQTKCELV